MISTTRCTTALNAMALAVLVVAMAASGAFAADRDNDGLRDHFETKHGVTSPDKKDSDKDGVVDGAEDSDGDTLGNLAEQRYRLDPTKRDSDGDGRSDGREDHDRDGIINKLEQYQRPVPRRLSPSLAKADTDFGDARGCNAKPGSSTVRRCWFGPTGTGAKVALMGDSHAIVLAGPFKQAAKADGFRLVTYFKGGCIPVLGTMNAGQVRIDGGRSCRDWRRKAITSINTAAPDLLVITASESYKLINASGGVVPKSKRPAKWREGMKSLIDAISPRTDVLVLGDVPNNGKHPLKCLKRNRDDMSKCTSRREAPSKRLVEMALRKAVDQKDARFGTLYGKICPTDPCPLVQGRTMMWRDRSHLTGTFSRKLTPSIRNILQSNLD